MISKQHHPTLRLAFGLVMAFLMFLCMNSTCPADNASRVNNGDIKSYDGGAIMVTSQCGMNTLDLTDLNLTLDMVNKTFEIRGNEANGRAFSFANYYNSQGDTYTCSFASGTDTRTMSLSLTTTTTGGFTGTLHYVKGGR